MALPIHNPRLLGNVEFDLLSVIKNSKIEVLDVNPVLSAGMAGRVWINKTTQHLHMATLPSGTAPDAIPFDVMLATLADANLYKTQAISESKSYTDTAITNLKGVAPAVLDTLAEIATSLGNDPNLKTTLETLITNKINDAITLMKGTATSLGDSFGELEKRIEDEKKAREDKDVLVDKAIVDAGTANTAAVKALKDQINANIFSGATTTAAKSHSIVHNLNSDHVTVHVWVKDTDNKYRTQHVQFEMTDNNTVKIGDFATAVNIMVEIKKAGKLS